VKDALREYGRTVAIFAAAGLVLSLLVGVLAGNPFGVIVLRALLFAVLFGGVGAGMQFVVRRFLPELATAEPSADAPADGSPEDAETKSGGSTIDIVLPEEPMPAEEAGAAMEEPLEELPGTGDTQPAATEAGGTSSPKATTASGAGAAPGGAAGLDFLPDIGSMQSGEPAPRATPPRRDRTRPSDAARDVLERQDPALLARGLRTILKRDERP
jgi:hypothetical protein